MKGHVAEPLFERLTLSDVTYHGDEAPSLKVQDLADRQFERQRRTIEVISADVVVWDRLGRSGGEEAGTGSKKSASTPNGITRTRFSSTRRISTTSRAESCDGQMIRSATAAMRRWVAREYDRDQRVIVSGKMKGTKSWIVITTGKRPPNRGPRGAGQW